MVGGHAGHYDVDIILPSSSVLEYRDKLFTPSPQKPASKGRIHNKGIVKLLLLLASPFFFFFFIDNASSPL